MTATNALTATDVVVDYTTTAGIVRALECPNLTVEAGTSLAIMGPSGCGKSTLLGLLAGLAVPTRGAISVGEIVLSELPERQRLRVRRRLLGMVYQADNLLPHLTVEENVALQLAIARPERCDETDPETDSGSMALVQQLEQLGLGDLAKRLPDQLSGGQRQRVAVARSIVHRPAVILADEPTGALDHRNAQRVIRLLVDVQRAIRATLVVVTHDPTIAAHLDGTIQLERPQQTQNQPPQPGI